MSMAGSDTVAYSWTQKLGLFLGLVVAVSCVLGAEFWSPPPGTTASFWRMLGVAGLVAIFWITEALPLGATALIPAASFPMLGIMPTEEVSQYYMSPIVLLLLGGFLLALVVEQTGAHERLALHVLLGVGTSPRRLVLGFSLTAAIMSMWISNTATALVMMPVALAVADRARGSDIPPEEGRAFTIALLLGTGYGASVGGMGTPVGTPSNLIVLKELSGKFPDAENFTFVTWALSSVPVVIIVVPLIWYALTRFSPVVSDALPLGAEAVLRSELVALGRWRASEIRALGIFALAAFLWVTRSDLRLGESIQIQGWASWLELTGTHDGAVAVGVAVIAFALPSGDRDGRRLLDWSTASKAPWGLVLLFGGGIAISKGFEATGVSAWLGQALAQAADGSMTAFVAVTTLAGTFGTELMSNVALANLALPILASTARESGLDPKALLWPVALACSCAFMMPAATGPNAIVFGTNRIRIIEMVRAGFIINWLAWGVIVIIALIRFPMLRGL